MSTQRDKRRRHLRLLLRRRARPAVQPPALLRTRPTGGRARLGAARLDRLGHLVDQLLEEGDVILRVDAVDPQVDELEHRIEEAFEVERRRRVVAR